MSDPIPLSNAARLIAEMLAGKAPSPGYREIYNDVLDGKIPAKQLNGRWHIERADLKAIADELRSGTKAPVGRRSR
jgi:hypothetical protein